MAARIGNEAFALRQQNDAAQERIADASIRMDACEERIARLLREQAELRDFRADSAHDISMLQSRADERKAAVSQFGSARNVTAFTAFHSAVGRAIDGRTRRDIDDAGIDIVRQVDLADDDIQREIDALRAQISSLEQAIWDNRRMIAMNDDAIARLSAGFAASP